MSAATASKASGAAAAGADGLLAISLLPGAALPLEDCRWPAELQSANAHFLLLLGVVAARLEPSGGGGYIERTGVSQDAWLRLADCDEQQIAGVVRRVERIYPGFRLDSGHAKGRGLLLEVDVHFATAQVRRQQERSG